MILQLLAALLPSTLLLLYICWKDPHKEPISKLLKAVLYGVFICVPVAFLEMEIDAIIIGDVGPYTLVGTTMMAFFVLIYFCIKMQRKAKIRVLALIEKDNKP